MSDWQWQVILALIRVVLRLHGNYGVYNQGAEDIALIEEALKRNE